MGKTICAISTPIGKGAISIVRLSGSESLAVAKRVFDGKNLSYESIMPRYLYLGNFNFKDGSKEKCLMVYFKTPFSYTGEDLIEFQIHGGSLLSQKVLNTLVENGATLAQPGEFTKRAFENGKVSLDEAESIIGEINADSESELKASLNGASGQLKNKIKSLQNSLTESIAQIEATLDYPEEDFEEDFKKQIFENIKQIEDEINLLIDGCKNSRYISKGINIAIVGSPNVGKSSLLNTLIGQERAIVTEIAGTTRDTLNESVEYQGVKLNFIDTAGIRDSENVVEKIGIERSKQAIENADVILFVLDGGREKENIDEEIEVLLDGKKNVVTIVNKNDKPRKLEKQENEISISALSNDNVGKIKEIIYDMVIKEKINFGATIITNERQIEILYECAEFLKQILSSKNESMDVIALLIKSLWNSLGKITGECENEKIIDLIFSKFCLGK